MSVRLPADVYSPDQLNIVLWELGALLERLHQVATTQKVTISANIETDMHLSVFLLGILGTSGVEKNDIPALEQLQVELTSVRDTSPVAHMVLPALPNRTLKRQLVEWFRTELHPQSLVTFAVRGDIGGGFLLRVGSSQYDFTFRNQLLENRHRIAEIFANVR